MSDTDSSLDEPMPEQSFTPTPSAEPTAIFEYNVEALGEHLDQLSIYPTAEINHKPSRPLGPTPKFTRPTRPMRPRLAAKVTLDTLTLEDDQPDDRTLMPKFILPHCRAVACVSRIQVNIFRDRHYSGPSVELRGENRLIMWGEQLPPTHGRIHHCTHEPKLLYYRSIQFTVPILVYLCAFYCDTNRMCIIPLVIRKSTSDIDMFIRRNIHYSSVYNPYGSGSYAHWKNHHIRYFIGWTLAKQHRLAIYE
jgi:hypothetical protein